MTKKEIIDHISETVNFCIADGNTYLYAKCIPTVKQDKEKIPIGGGNFTVLLSTLATLEFLGTIDAIIEGKSDDFWNDAEIKKFQKVAEDFKNDCDKEEDDRVKNFFSNSLSFLAKKGRIKKGSGSCLVSFLKETKEITGINEDEIKKIRTVRNKLAHEFTPKIKSALGVDFMPGTDFVSLILQHDKEDVSCLSSENRIGINSNALNRKLGKLLKYVIAKLEKLSDESETINKIKEYIEDVE